MVNFLQFLGSKLQKQPKKNHNFEISDVTPEQELRIPEFLEDWDRLARNTNSVDMEGIKKATRALFTSLKLTPPQDFRYYPSPTAAFHDLENWRCALSAVSTFSWEFDFHLPDTGPEGRLAPGILSFLEYKMRPVTGIEWLDPWFDEVDTQVVGNHYLGETGVSEFNQDGHDSWILSPEHTLPLAAAANFLDVVLDFPLDLEFTESLSYIAKNAGLLFTLGSLVLVIDRPSGFETLNHEWGPIPVYNR